MKPAVIALLAAAFALSACASGAAEGHLSAAQARAVRDEARHALATVEQLRSELSDLEDRLEAMRARDRRAGQRLGRLSDKLWNVLAKLRGKVADASAAAGAVKQDADAAQSAASSALDEAEQVGKDLAVLEQRFDYHLRHSGGG
jgi:TolA-binding protein